MSRKLYRESNRPTIRLPKQVRRTLEELEEDHVRLLPSDPDSLFTQLLTPVTAYINHHLARLWSVVQPYNATVLTYVLYICISLLLIKLILYYLLRMCEAYVERVSDGVQYQPQEHQNTERETSSARYATEQRSKKGTSSAAKQRGGKTSPTVSKAPQRTYLTSLGKDLDRERKERQMNTLRRKPSKNATKVNQTTKDEIKVSEPQKASTSVTSKREEKKLA